MLKQFMNGELGLKETFWKFGFIGLIVFIALIRLFESLLQAQIGNMGILTYYTHYFTPINPNSGAIFWTLCYLSGLFLFAVYSMILLKSIWKSAATYQKSPLLGGLAKFFTLLFVFLAFYSIY